MLHIFLFLSSSTLISTRVPVLTPMTFPFLDWH